MSPRHREKGGLIPILSVPFYHTMEDGWVSRAGSGGREASSEAAVAILLGHAELFNWSNHEMLDLERTLESQRTCVVQITGHTHEVAEDKGG